jgi:serine/threonine-protein kinase mTOR
MVRFPYILLAYVAIGHVSGVVGSNMKPFLNQIMISIKQALQARGYVIFTASPRHIVYHENRRKGAPSEAPILQCLGMLAASVGPNLTKLLHDQLELIFACGLSEPLLSALLSIATNIPPLLTTIQGAAGSLDM